MRLRIGGMALPIEVLEWSGDAAKIVSDFKSITAHMHLKDYSGWEHFQGYVPLGEGKVDIQGAKRATIPTKTTMASPVAPSGLRRR